jgi:Uma2 family endonuclease
MAYIRRDEQRHTYGDYLTWSADYGDELIDGIAYVREPPAPSRHHQKMVGDLFVQVWNALEGKPHHVYCAPFDVRLPKSNETNEQIDTVVQPDLLIVCDLNKLDDRGMRGAPDWIAEILSPGTARYDQTTKIPVYERAGVREVWLIHPANRTLTLYQLKNGCYGHPERLELRGKTPLTAVPDVSIDWDRLYSQQLPKTQDTGDDRRG